MVDIQLSNTTVLVTIIALAGLTVYGVNTLRDLIDELVIQPGEEAGGAITGTFSTLYDDFVEPLSPASIGDNINDFFSWVGSKI